MYRWFLCVICAFDAAPFQNGWRFIFTCGPGFVKGLTTYCHRVKPGADNVSHTWEISPRCVIKYKFRRSLDLVSTSRRSAELPAQSCAAYFVLPSETFAHFENELVFIYFLAYLPYNPNIHWHWNSVTFDFFSVKMMQTGRNVLHETTVQKIRYWKCISTIYIYTFSVVSMIIVVHQRGTLTQTRETYRLLNRLP